MPLYNTERYLKTAIESILAQTYTNWELLITDDCSSDGSVAIVESYMEHDSRIKLFHLNKNSGAAMARNLSLCNASGRFIAFLDSDDIWAKNKLEQQVKFMIDNNYKFSYTNYYEKNNSKNCNDYIISGPSKITKIKMFAFCWVGCLTVMYDADAIGKIQVKDIKANNDYAMWLRMVRRADCYLLNENLAIYNRGRFGSISTNSIYNLTKSHYIMFRKSENMSIISSVIMTLINIICGLYKKIRYRKRVSKFN